MFRLTTRQYWYRVQHAVSLQSPAVFRFEYVGNAPRDGYCRYHAQMPAEVKIGDGTLDLDKAHLPTGRVSIEEFLRFLIVDLGVSPPCGDDWPAVLEDSERAFVEDYASHRYKPPAG